MHDEGYDHQPAIAHLVGDQRAQDDNDPEAPQAASSNIAQFLLRETVLPGPVHEDRATDGEAYTVGKNGEEARP